MAMMLALFRKSQKHFHIKMTWLAILICGLFFPMDNGGAIDLGDAPIRGYPVSLTIQKKRLELSADYLAFKSDLDVMGIMENDPAGTDQYFWAGTPVEMTGFRAFLNYGLFEKVMVRSAFHYRKFGYDTGDMAIRSLDACVKYNINANEYGWMPFCALDFGIQTNYTDDMIGYRDVVDRSAFVRLTYGKIFGDMMPNHYLEYGVTSISANMVPDSTLPDPGRDETYFKTGLSLLIRFPYTAMTQFEYAYIRMFRDQDLAGPDDNHILKANVNFFLTDRLILNLGSEFYLRQFNGIIPLLYHEDTKDRINHPFGRYHIGITYLFEGK